MIRRNKLQILMLGMLLVSMVILSGCGSGSLSTNGTLAVAEITKTDMTGGNYSVETSATFAPASGKVLPGTEISYTATFVGGVTTSRSGNLYTDSTGKVIIGPWPIIQDVVPIVVTINASIGGLSSTKVTSIPAITVTN